MVDLFLSYLISYLVPFKAQAWLSSSNKVRIDFGRLSGDVLI